MLAVMTDSAWINSTSIAHSVSNLYEFLYEQVLTEKKPVGFNKRCQRFMRGKEDEALPFPRSDADRFAVPDFRAGFRTGCPAGTIRWRGFQLHLGSVAIRGTVRHTGTNRCRDLTPRHGNGA